MPAAVWNLLIEQGATWNVLLTLTGRDLSGCTARMQVREHVASPAPLLELTTGNGAITIDGPDGTISLLLPDEQTAAITWRHGVYDLELVTAGGEVERLLRGEVDVDFEVTR